MAMDLHSGYLDSVCWCASFVANITVLPLTSTSDIYWPCVMQFVAKMGLIASAMTEHLPAWCQEWGHTPARFSSCCSRFKSLQPVAL